MTKREQELLDYFISQTNERLKEFRGEMSLVNAKLDDLYGFKWKVIGAASLLSMAVSIAVEVFFKTG